MHAQKVIEKLGYSKNEAKVYLVSLQFGTSTVTDLAKKVEIPRTSTQVILEKLHQDGLMNFYVQRQHRYWTAENPEKFLTRLQEKEGILKTVIPKLEALRHSGKIKSSAKVFSSPSDINLIRDDILTTKHRLYGIITWDKWLEDSGDRNDDFTTECTRNFLPTQLLVQRTVKMEKLKSRNKKGLQQIRFLPKSFSIENTTFIYGNKVVFISFTEKPPTTIVIDAKDIHDMMLTFFEDLWNRSTE